MNGMGRFIGKKVLWAAITIVGATFIVFALSELQPDYWAVGCLVYGCLACSQPPPRPPNSFWNWLTGQ